MKRAIFLTAFDRVEYLQRTLESWDHVRNVSDWDWHIRIEPSERSEEIYALATDFFCRNLIDGDVEINDEVYGVLHHPWRVFEELFGRGYDFVLRAEDDLRVSDDVLRFFEWASYEFQDAPEVATVHGFTMESGVPDAAEVKQEFNSWIWGTWLDRWKTVIGPTWDHMYSTFNGFPGNESGWDWNLNTRVFPREALHGVYPLSSRVDNIGLIGVHGTHENHRTSPSFHETYGRPAYRLAEVDIP